MCSGRQPSCKRMGQVRLPMLRWRGHGHVSAFVEKAALNPASTDGRFWVPGCDAGGMVGQHGRGIVPLSGQFINQIRWQIQPARMTPGRESQRVCLVFSCSAIMRTYKTGEALAIPGDGRNGIMITALIAADPRAPVPQDRPSSPHGPRRSFLHPSIPHPELVGATKVPCIDVPAEANWYPYLLLGRITRAARLNRRFPGRWLRRRPQTGASWPDRRCYSSTKALTAVCSVPTYTVA